MSRDPFIGGSDRQKNPYDDLFTRMNQDQDKNRLFSEAEKDTKKSAIEALMTTALKKVIDLFTISAERSISKAERTFIEDDLEKMKKAFQRLVHEDLSQDVPFLKELSFVWHDFMKNYHVLYSNKKSIIVQKIEEIVESISTYPEDEDSTMGFYLTQYAGEDWLPFPYMDMIQRLHKDHKDLLKNWISKIEDIIVEVKKRKKFRK